MQTTRTVQTVRAGAAFTLALCMGASRDAAAFGGTAGELERQGNFVVTNDAGFSFSQELGSPNATGFVLRPALDYFVVAHWSVGGAVELDVSKTGPRNPTATNFALSPEVGYEFALSDTWSFWPQASLTLGFPSGSPAVFSTELFAPFLLHPAEHFFFGLGPGFTVKMAPSPVAGYLTAGFIVGGYFDH
ncbi:MAG: hypothetical protein ABSC94_19895 [Polyangiaceae bacterium]